MSTVAERIETIERDIAEIAERVGRTPEDITLIAISKGHALGALRDALEVGQTALGESYVQEWQSKSEELSEDSVDWHFVGGLQSNKIRYLVDNVGLIHSIDRKKLMKEVNKRADNPQRILIQVNVSGEGSKSGCEPQLAEQLVEYALEAERVHPVGLMTIPPLHAGEEETRQYFRTLRELRDDIQDALSDLAGIEDFCELSMGMTADYPLAIEEGATLIRVGTGIFGPR